MNNNNFYITTIDFSKYINKFKKQTKNAVILFLLFT